MVILVREKNFVSIACTGKKLANSGFGALAKGVDRRNEYGVYVDTGCVYINETNLSP